MSDRARRTLRGRVAVIALAAIAGWLALLTIVFNVIVMRRLQTQAVEVAHARATAAAATVRFGDGRPTVLESPADAALDYGIWLYIGDHAVQRAQAPVPLQQRADALAGRGVIAGTTDSAVLSAEPLRQGGRQVGTVVASVSFGPYQDTANTALVGSIVLSLLLLAGAYPVLRLAGGRALQPMEEMAHQARDWSAHDPAQRFGGGQRFAELDELALTLDGVLDRLSAVLRHERQLSAELSHELRTPLSTIVAEADLLLSRKPDETGYRAIHDSALAMDEIIETLLVTARADLRSDESSCDVRAVVSRLAQGRAVPIDVHGDDEILAGVDEAVVARLLAPILDNVVRHARTRVVVELTRRPKSVRIELGNDGPPIPQTRLERIFEPGVTGGNGAGLGLTLARRLARAADGDVVALPVPDHAVFRVTLPLG